MKKISLVFSTVALLVASTAVIDAGVQKNDLTSQIPLIDVTQLKGYEKVNDVAHYSEADWSNAVGIARGISLQRAKAIADGDPKITYFFFVKGGKMVLPNSKEAGMRVFKHGDAVFFSGKPWWGEANGLSDGYVKTK